MHTIKRFFDNEVSENAFGLIRDWMWAVVIMLGGYFFGANGMAEKIIVEQGTDMAGYVFLITALFLAAIPMVISWAGALGRWADEKLGRDDEQPAEN